MNLLKVIKYGLLGLLGLFILATIASGVFTVHERERYVVTRGGELVRIATPGFNFKMPWVESAEPYSIAVQTTTLTKLETFTTGAQPQHVDLDFRIQWEIPPANVEQVFRLGRNVETLLQGMIIDRAKQEFGQRHANDIPSQRGEIVRTLLTHIREQAETLYGIHIIDLQLTNFDYSPNFRAEVDRAAVAMQNQARVQTEAKTAEDQARGAANAAIQAAQGAAEARLRSARAEAEAVRLAGEATASATLAQARAVAEGYRAQGEALAANPRLVELRQAERWSGNLPNNFVPNSAIPFLSIPGTGNAPAPPRQ